jgi:hypothetical protein
MVVSKPDRHYTAYPSYPPDAWRFCKNHPQEILVGTVVVGTVIFAIVTAGTGPIFEYAIIGLLW